MTYMNKQMSNITLHNGNSTEVLKQYPDNHFDSIVTDPPYGIEFLGKDWDSNTGAIEVWQECLRVLKPGGYLLAFGAPRTYHRLATNLEDIGFEIKDSLMWLYGQGFPKAQDVGKRMSKKGIDNEWAGWKTGLKPAHEPIVMCRKPTKLSAMDNVLEWGVGALNIDATRIEDRFPSNVIGEVEGYQQYFYHPKVNRKERHWGLDADAIDKVSQNTMKEHPLWEPSMGTDINRLKAKIQQNYLDSLPRPGTRMGGKEGERLDNGAYMVGNPNAVGSEEFVPRVDANTHPTIKPVALMLYLVKLITPPNGKVLDPFNGSGSTGMAVKEFGGEYVGIDLDENYIEISRKRIDAWGK